MQRTTSMDSLSSTASDKERQAQKAEQEETMQIFVKDISGENTIPLNLPPSTTIATLRTLLSLRLPQPTPKNIRLLHSGRHLSSPTSTLSSYSIPPNSTIHLTLPVRGGGGPKKPRCSFKDCKDAAQRIVGDCGFCKGAYCGKHRLLEDHKCVGLEDCKKEGRERNREVLERERTVVVRGI